MKLFIAAAAILACCAGNAYASSCTQAALPQAIESADVIFRGTVTSVEFEKESFFTSLLKGELSPSAGGAGGCGKKDVVFTISKTWKGAPDAEAVVSSEDACAGPGAMFEVGREYLVFAKLGVHEGVLATASCSRTATAEGTQAQQDIAQLDKLPQSDTDSDAM